MKLDLLLASLALLIHIGEPFRYPSPVLFNYSYQRPRYTTFVRAKPEIVEDVTVVPPQDLNDFKQTIFASLRKLGRTSLNQGKS